MIENDSLSQQQGVKFSHKKWKALLKKQKRKTKRQNEAHIRETQEKEEQKKKEQSPSFQAREQERIQMEQMEEHRLRAEKSYFNKLWMEKERIAQLEFEKKKKWEEKEKIRKAEVERKIKEEWEERQRKEKEEQEREEKKKKHQDSLLQQATANENKDGEEPWHNPIASLVPGKEKETCPFFAKTGACRFGDRCSRGHPQPDSSTTMLIRGMYSHFELEQGLLDENDTDLILEYEDSEIYNNFRDFYDDIVPEFKSLGHVTQVKVCCNYEPHLRGNVYVQFSREEETHAAMVKMNGRFYGGKQISCEPVEIKSWKSAICGLFGRGRCPKGRNCNFLHVFKNPRNEFWEYDKPFQKKSYQQYNRHGHSQRSNRYSRSRSSSPYGKQSQRRHSYSRDRFDYRSKKKHSFRSRKYSRSRSKERHSRSRSRDRYSRPRSRDRYSRSRSRDRYSRSRSRDRYSRSRSRSRRHSRDRSSVSYAKKPRNPRSRSKERYKLSRSRSKEMSRSYSRSKSKSKSPSRQKSKKKKHKHKKNKKHSILDKTDVSNGDNNNTKGCGTQNQKEMTKTDQSSDEK